MSPCIAAMNGMPPNRYGFHSGMRPCSRKNSAPKRRKPYPALNWSLIGPTRNFPASMGQQSDSMATTNTASAARNGQRGVNGEDSGTSGCDTRTLPGAEEEWHRGTELGESEQQPRGDGQRD